jgi:type IV secretory pathway VirB10-like protein
VFLQDKKAKKKDKKEPKSPKKDKGKTKEPKSPKQDKDKEKEPKSPKKDKGAPMEADLKSHQKKKDKDSKKVICWHLLFVYASTSIEKVLTPCLLICLSAPTHIIDKDDLPTADKDNEEKDEEEREKGETPSSNEKLISKGNGEILPSAPELESTKES